MGRRRNSTSIPKPGGAPMSTDSVQTPSAQVHGIAVQQPTNLRHFQPGELIFSEGSFGDCAYILESGHVEIFVESKGQHILLKQLGPGEIFGEMAVIDALPRSASARALDHCCCLVVSSLQISERIQSADPVVKLLIEILLNRTRKYNFHLKSRSGNTFPNQIFQSLSAQAELEQQHHLEVIDKMRLESELQQAVSGNELIPYYQPLVNLTTLEIVGLELLMRWQNPNRGLISPSLFINLAEETSLIIPLGFFALEQACLHLRCFQEVLYNRGITNRQLFISVNVSVRQFQDPHFFTRAMEIMNHYGVDPAQIKLEVTERIFLEGMEAIQAIQRCRQAGFGISLDDFGTGFSSLNYIARCEVDSLKIDQSFVRQLFSNDKIHILVQTIIHLTKGLKMPSLAEGIETLEQVKALRLLGCEIGQGYFFSKPLPFADAIALLGHPPVGKSPTIDYLSID